MYENIAITGVYFDIKTLDVIKNDAEGATCEFTQKISPPGRGYLISPHRLF
jgi:hypothetical protein